MYLLLQALLTIALLSSCQSTPFKKMSPPLVFVDPGHSDNDWGSTSCRGIREVVYNDRLAAKVVEILQVKTRITHLPHEEMDLDRRVAVANEAGASLFISIHHDSAQPQYLTTGDHEALISKIPIRGFSIFISNKNGDYENSLRFAKRLGSEMVKQGRAPSLHHAEKIPGEERTLVDPRLGIYRYDELRVLKDTKMAAVLLEAGVIVDPVDEAYLSKNKNQEKLARAVTRAVLDYLEVGVSASQKK